MTIICVRRSKKKPRSEGVKLHLITALKRFFVLPSTPIATLSERGVRVDDRLPMPVEREQSAARLQRELPWTMHETPRLPTGKDIGVQVASDMLQIHMCSLFYIMIAAYAQLQHSMSADHDTWEKTAPSYITAVFTLKACLECQKNTSKGMYDTPGKQTYPFEFLLHRLDMLLLSLRSILTVRYSRLVSSGRAVPGEYVLRR